MRRGPTMRSARRGTPPCSLDGELALHAGLAMAGHRAVERVVPGLEVDVDLRGPAALDDLALLVDPVALDGDVVADRLVVLGLERHLARGRLGVLELEEQAAGLVDRDVEHPALLLGGALRL